MFIHIYNELQQISKHSYHIHLAGSVTGDAAGVDAAGVDAGGVDAGGVDAGGVDAAAVAVDAGVDAATVVPASLRFPFKFSHHSHPPSQHFCSQLTTQCMAPGNWGPACLLSFAGS